MPNCCVSGCKSNYDPDNHFPVFKMPGSVPNMKYAWSRALNRENIGDLKVVCVYKAISKSELDYTFKVSK